MPHQTNEIRLRALCGRAPLVTGKEKIAVFGAAGQVGTKLKPLLDRLYPGQVVYCESPQHPNAAALVKNGFKLLDVTSEAEIGTFLKEKKIKAIIHLAALLSAAADQDPELAHHINLIAPMHLFEIAKKSGVEKLQMMSSMASQEFGESAFDSRAVARIKKELQRSAGNRLHAIPIGQYAQQKTIIERLGDYYSSYQDIDVSIPRLAGVLNCHLDWPSNGTTEELDKLVIAAAVHAVYGAKWEKEMRRRIGRRDQELLDKGHYLRDGNYVPEVSANTVFDMIDGKTLPEVVLLLLHTNLRPGKKNRGIGVVHNVSEYSVSMRAAAKIVKQLNPDFPLRFATNVKNGLDEGKETRARLWPTSQDTRSTEALIGKFKEHNAEESIRENYRRVVAVLKTGKTNAAAA